MPPRQQVSQDPLALALELISHLLVVPRASGDLFSLLLDRAVDGVEPRPLVEEEALLPLRLQCRDLAFELGQRVLGDQGRDLALTAAVALLLVLAGLRPGAIEVASQCGREALG